MFLRCLAVAIVVGFGAGAECSFAEGSSEKSTYTLFNAVPDSMLRELATDRPDKTESPISVDAGHFQFEVSLLSVVLDGSGSEATVMEVNAKAGLSPSTDLQFIFSPAVGTPGVWQFLPESQIRFKWNLVGNDGGDFALGLLPFAVLPVSEGQALDAGLSVPFGFSLPADFAVGLMATLESLDSRDLSTMVTVGHDLAGDLAGYIEFFNTLPAMGTENWVATLDLGLTYGMTPNLQWDAGVNIGLTEDAPDLEPFLGVSARF